MQVNSETEEVILSDYEDQNKKEEKNEVKNANPITLISMFFENTFFLNSKLFFFSVQTLSIFEFYTSIQHKSKYLN